MIHFTSEHSKIKYENIVSYVENISDVKILDFLNFSEEIISCITKSLNSKKQESELLEFFVGTKKCKKVFVFVSHEKNYESKTLFLGKYFPKLPEELCLIAETLENQKLLLEVCELSRYSFQRYKTEKKHKKTEILCSKEEKIILEDCEETIENITLARDLWETPAPDLTPEIFADIVKKTKFKNIKVKILKYKDIQKQKLGLIEWVGKWSENKPCLVILEHIVDKKQPVHGIVWKGVTFDTWGNQIKPGNLMYDMKWDMWGAAVTLGLMKELDRHNIKKNIVACLCLAENVVSSNAYKPSDILTSYCWKTVEIIHTDAEWRLVLADGISYVWKNYKTETMMTIATLTWAVMVALWFRYAGIMWDNEEMIDSILEYSKDNTEKYIRLPLDDHFAEKTKSEIADYKNLDTTVHAGSSMWGAFLKNFLHNNEKYTHIDIAGAYINEWEAYGKMPKWMTGFWVESLSAIFKS